MPASYPVPWSQAMQAALYAPAGFYRREQPGQGPAAHFRTSVHASPAFARAVLTLLARVDEDLGRPERLALVDVGAGRGELLVAVAGLLEERPGLAARTHLLGVEVVGRPAALPSQIAWSADLPEQAVGLLVANEWLDNVPLDVVELAPDGAREVLVDPATGHEVLGGPVPASHAEWLDRWWPLDPAADVSRAEVGRTRDDAWAGAVACLSRGLAVAIDYGHLLADRAGGAYATGTLVGYRSGRLVPPVPDGSCDITAHVAMDSVAEAGLAAGAASSTLLRQREALRDLGVTASPELTDPEGLGAFWWLLQPVHLEPLV